MELIVKVKFNSKINLCISAFELRLCFPDVVKKDVDILAFVVI